MKTFLAIFCLIFFARASHAESSSSQDEIEIASGRSFFGRIGDFFNSGTGKVYPANWLEARARWNSFGFQLGAHQSDDMTKGTGGIVLDRGAQFTAIFAGIQTELVELVEREPRPLRVFVGGGGTYLQSIFFSSRTRPYFSLEMSSEIKKRLQARAGIFLSLAKEAETFGAAIPEVTLQYWF